MSNTTHTTNAKAALSRAPKGSRLTVPTFYLGTIVGGSTFIFTALGGFRSVDAALAKANSSPRNGAVFVFETCGIRCRGIEIGSTGYEWVATAQR